MTRRSKRDGSLTAQNGTNVKALLLCDGMIKRVAIITVDLHPCACYLARRLRSAGVEIAIYSQRHQTKRLARVRYLRRLLNRRGWLVFADNLLLECVRRVQRPTSSLSGDVVPQGTLPPSLRLDPDIVQEPWLRVQEVTNINSEVSTLEDFAPDLVLLAGAPILSRRTIEVARVACLNPHCGITPWYAGNDPQVWAVFDKRFDAIGFTIHTVVPVVDGGPVIYQERVQWQVDEPIDNTWPLLAQRMYDKLADITLALIAGEEVTAHPQSGVSPRPPAGWLVRRVAEARRRRYARGVEGGPAPLGGKPNVSRAGQN